MGITAKATNAHATSNASCFVRSADAVDATAPRQEVLGKRSMSQYSFRFPRAYRLKAIAEREEDALSLLTVGASNRNVILPYSAGLDYVVVSTGGGVLSMGASVALSGGSSENVAPEPGAIESTCP